MDDIIKFGTAKRAETYRVVLAELMTWTLKALRETAEACNIGYRSRTTKRKLAGEIAILWLNCRHSEGCTVPWNNPPETF